MPAQMGVEHSASPSPVSIKCVPAGSERDGDGCIKVRRGGLGLRSGCLLEARSHRKPLNGRELRSAVGRLVIDGWDESERDCV